MYERLGIGAVLGVTALVLCEYTSCCGVVGYRGHYPIIGGTMEPIVGVTALVVFALVLFMPAFLR